MTDHHFNIEIAQKYGVYEAIFLKNLEFWTRYNKANKTNYHECRYWTYNSIQAFSELFPYFTTQQLRTVIKNCINNNLIIKKNFNQTKYDRTTWYALTDKGLSLTGIEETQSQPDLLNLTNGFGEINKPIPNIKTNNKLTTSTQVIFDKKNNKEQSLNTPDQMGNPDALEITPVELLEIYEEEMPDNPKPLVNKANGQIEKKVKDKIRDFKKYWKAATKKDLTKEKFRAYLQLLKEESPGLVENEYMNKGGQITRNGLGVFLNWETCEKLRQNRVY